MKILKEIEKIIPDFRQYYLDWELKEMTEEDLIYTLEHEIDLYKNWKEEGFRNQQEVSYINKNNIRKVNRLLKRYYNKNGNWLIERKGKNEKRNKKGWKIRGANSSSVYLRYLSFLRMTAIWPQKVR